MDETLNDELQKILDTVDPERCISAVPESAERLCLAFAKARIPFTYTPCKSNNGFNYDTGMDAIRVHAKPEVFTPIFNFAISASEKFQDPIERDILKKLLEKYGINLVICPKENDNKWDML